MIKLTAVAAEHLKKAFGPDQKVRLSVKPGGCTGFTYLIDKSTDVNLDDYVFVKEGLTFCVDKRSFLLLRDIEIGYESGIMKSGFTFSNPNATANCGCGKSFGV